MSSRAEQSSFQKGEVAFPPFSIGELLGFDAANAVAAFAASCPLDKNISDKSEREAPM